MTEIGLPELRLVQRADVYKQGRLAGTLTRSSAGVEFRYLPEWIAGGGEPVASTLPLQPDPVLRPGGAVPSYFAGLLPEGRRLTVLRQQVKTSADDELSLLLAVGSDVIGDVQVLPADVAPAPVAPRLEVADFATVRFADLLAELGIRAERTGLPGVQDKVSAAMVNLPVARRGAQFILKLDPPEYSHLVANEAFFLAAAQGSGIETVDTEVVVDADGRQGLLVQRFDRVLSSDGSSPRMLAVEDGCQVLDRPPADKYNIEVAEAFGALTRLCQAPLPAARVLLAQLVFAYMTGNGDAHAKNFSVLRGSNGEWRPSPAYDLPSTQPYGDTTIAMPMLGRVSGDFGRDDFVALGAAVGLPDRATRKLIDELVARADTWRDKLDELPFDTGRTRKLRRVVDYRLQRLRD